MSETSFNQGSIWRKWDLHVHSPMSILNNQFPKKVGGEPDWDKYIDKLEQTDISVLGVTDYFSIAGYKKVLEYKESGRLSNIELILPNVELRLNILGRDGRRVNLHVIFSEDVLPSHIEDHFLHELYFTKTGNPQNTDDKEKLKPENLVNLGRRLKAENPHRFSSLSDLEAGATIATVEDVRVSEVLHSSWFKGKYSLVLAQDGLPNWNTQGHGVRQTLTQKADFIFSSNPQDIKWYLGLNDDYPSQQDFINEFHSLKPCIHGSDAHEIFFVSYPCAKRGEKGHDCKSDTQDCDLRYCWIKADPTFEGLKQVLYEPEDRVRIQRNDPTPSRHNYTLSNIALTETVINDELTVAATNIPLHRSLIAVTGGRGAGKTAFVDLIANCFENRAGVEDKNSFVWRICNEDDPDLRTTLQFEDEEEFTKSVADNKYIEETDIAYISQGELNHYIVENTRLTHRIQELIFSSVKEIDKYEYQNLSQKIEDYEKQISALSMRIIELEEKTSQQTKRELDKEKKRIETTINDIERQIKEIEDATDDEEILETAQKAQIELAKLRDKQEQLKELKQHLERAKVFLTDDIVRFNKEITAINELLGELGTSDTLPPIDYSDENILDDLIDDVEDNLKETLKEIDDEQNKLDQSENEASKHTKLLDMKSEEERKLQNIDKQLEVINNLENQLKEATANRANLFKEILNLVKDTQRKYTEIIRHFGQQLTTYSSNIGTKDVLKDLEFFAEIQFDRTSFLKDAEDLFNNRRVAIDREFEGLLDRFKEFVDGQNDATEALAGSIEEYVRNAELRGKIKTNSSINVDDYFRFFYKNYLTVKPIAKYKQTSLDRLSLGQKATVLIKIYLAQGRKPIVIDSHDDHLDNHFIMDELIPAIREAKKFRQIILVSNNANVVVNTDAEQIIIANRDDVSITFASGSLESLDIRAEALKVLEGGEEAFKQRQRKYRLV